MSVCAGESESSGPNVGCGTKGASVLTVVLFAVYASGACPTIYVGDSGELVTAVHTLGIPHPSGYPLYVMLGKVWTILVPVGSIAWRMSLFSAVCAAAACSVLYWLCRQLALDRFSALLAASLLAFGPSFWGEANVQRVYALGALFLLLATAVTLHWYRHGETRCLVLAFFLCGLGAANHTFMAINALAIGVFAAAVRPAGFLNLRTLGKSIVAFAVGLTPYLYLPLRSLADPPLDWGNPETPRALLNVILRRAFWDRAWMEGPRDLLPITADYLHSLGSELAWMGAALAVVGFIVSWKRDRLVLLPLAVMIANLVAVSFHGSRTDIFIWHRYYIPSYAMAALLAGLGCHSLLSKLPKPLVWLPLVIPAFLMTTGWHQFDRSRYRIAETYSRAVLDSLSPGSRLIATDDNILFVLLYLKFVEQLRPDVELITQGVGAAELPPLRFDPDREPLFFTHHPNWKMKGLDIIPIGLVFQAHRTGMPPPDPVLPIESLPGEFDRRVPKDFLTENLSGQFHYMLGFTFEQRDWPRARREFAAAASAAPRNDVLFYNMGLIFRRNGLLDDAVEAFERSAAINPRHLATHSRPRASERIAEVSEERKRLVALEQEMAELPILQSVTQGTAEFHRRLAALLEGRDEARAARGHRLIAQEREAPRLIR